MEYIDTRMLFRLTNAPEALKRAMGVIRISKWQCTIVHMKEVIIFSKTPQDHVKHVEEVLELLKTAGMTLKLKKRHFFSEFSDYREQANTAGSYRWQRPQQEQLSRIVTQKMCPGRGLSLGCATSKHTLSLGLLKSRRA